jgi:hypothetical protein
MSTVWIRVTYGVVIALLVFLTVVFGIQMVSAGPKPPEDPLITFRQLSSSEEDDASVSQNTLTAKIDQVFGDASAYRDDYPTYQRNVFLGAAGFGVLVVLIGLALPVTVNYLRFGLVLGGLMLFIYAFYFGTRPVPEVTPQVVTILSLLGTGHAQPLDFASRFVQFAVAFIGLILTLFLGLWRLTEWSPGPRRVVSAPAVTGPPVMAAPGAVPSSQWAPPPPPSPAPPVRDPEPVVATPVAATVPSAAPAASPAPAPSPASSANSEPGDAPPPEWRRPE